MLKQDMEDIRKRFSAMTFSEKLRFAADLLDQGRLTLQQIKKLMNESVGTDVR